MDRQATYQIINATALRQLFWVLAFLFTHASSHAASDINNIKFKLPPNHQSTYQIEKYDTTVGEMKNTLSYRNGVINYSSVAEANGLATLFISAKPTEISILNWPENAPLTFPQQQSFNFVQEKDHKRNQQIIFETLKTGETLVEGRYKFKAYSFKTDKKVWSRQLLLLLISSDFQLKPNIRSNSFFIADKGHIKKYTYTVLATQTLKYQNKDLPVIKIQILKENSKRMSYAWLSKTQFYLPLKIEHYKDEALNLRMQLTQLKLNNND